MYMGSSAAPGSSCPSVSTPAISVYSPHRDSQQTLSKPSDVFQKYEGNATFPPEGPGLVRLRLQVTSASAWFCHMCFIPKPSVLPTKVSIPAWKLQTVLCEKTIPEYIAMTMNITNRNKHLNISRNYILYIILYFKNQSMQRNLSYILNILLIGGSYCGILYLK